MLDYLFLSAALIGSAVGGWIDLKTTEIPDTVPLSMLIAGIILHIAYAWQASSILLLKYALAVSISYLVFGYILYYSGQWGEADVLLLAALGFLIPQPLSMFASMQAGIIYPVVFLLNTFIIGGVYSIIYAFVVASKSKGFSKALREDIIKSKVSLVKIIAVVICAALAITFAFSRSYTIDAAGLLSSQLLFLLPASIALFTVYRFAHVLDNTAFRKQVETSDLVEGDVLAESVSAKTKDGNVSFSGKLFVGLSKDDIKKLKTHKKKVWIKEGIRYGPTFFLSILATWLFGNLVFLVATLF